MITWGRELPADGSKVRDPSLKAQRAQSSAEEAGRGREGGDCERRKRFPEINNGSPL
jgi:hypothetical protein